MTSNEIKLIVMLLKERKRYYDCNPEVGMGPFVETLVREIRKESGIDFDVEFITSIIKKEW